MTAPSRHPAVGIDVVDLTEARIVATATDGRFAARVLAADERARVAHSRDPDLALWLHWAAKEAAFKAISAVRGRAPVFRHAAFRVTLRDLPEAGGRGVLAPVVFEGRSITVRAWLHAGAVVAVGWVADVPDRADGHVPDGTDGVVATPEGAAGAAGATRWWIADLERLAETLDAREPWEALRAGRFRPEEARSVHSTASALVRLAARREAARTLGLDERDLAVVCAEGPAGRTPPSLLRVGGGAAAAAISLSHHGRWAAWALARSAPAKEGSVGTAERS